MDRLRQIELFMRVSDLGSLSKAAENLGMSDAAASRHLSALETRLGARLVERNTRRLWLTEVGQEFYQRCVQPLAELDDAENAVGARAATPKGLLKITSSISFAMIYLSPILPAFRARYPQLSVQIVAANRYPDFIESGIDVAIRTREHEPDSNIIVRRLATTRRVLAASPGYLAQRGAPETPDQLAAHDMLIYNLANEPYVLKLQNGSTTRKIRVNSVLEANDGQVIRAAALAAHGILVQPLYIVHSDIKAGRLKTVLDDWKLPPLTMNIAYQNRERLPIKISVFVDFLTAHLRATMVGLDEISPAN
jgi:DNA-binding transcriptional LysR family regulator